ncbi:hypothetical protein [Chryseobacterium hagamense]|uniref:Uncharacterized protein n=1 Tax=Chryseobacterium hagamense TaxID=395935 RepID=A0A511YHQ9_9FLAO|nr:hypothetical protein [Chryseobacterium hagamense]GEN74739.1 hypothetical protein CHA01nite_04790 [Chryseobacterium hagamense]
MKETIYKMELDFRKLNADKLFSFSREQEQLIFEIYDRLSGIYDLSVVAIEDSPFQRFNSGAENSLFSPEICYFITDQNKENPFYLFIVSKIGTTAKGARTTAIYDSLQIWGMKILNEDYGFISVSKKKWTDRIAGVFTRYNINFKNREFNDYYVLGIDRFKTMAFLKESRQELIKAFPNENFRLEIKNNILNFGLPENINVDNALNVAEFLKQV